ncbi:MAG: metal ABC transporter substrate-binding protein [Lachnospiraceae bacterium]|nr:metal ABC transporter substrate-binding protein [Lachnospiraceae bacterium]
MKKRRFAAVLLLLLLAGILGGCGKQEDKTTEGDKDAAAAETSGLSSDSTTLTVATNPGVHADILNKAAEILSGKGVQLEIFTYEDYYMPNLLVDDGDADANYFQHEVYLENFNKSLDTHLVSVGSVHFEPLGIYPGQKKSISDLTNGDVIVIPEDATNKTRALKLLQNVGIVSLTQGKDELTLSDITENPYGVNIVPEEASLIPTMVQDAAFIVLNGNYARDSFLSVTKDALAYENAESSECDPYWNVLAVNEGNENDPRIQKLIEVLQSQEMKDYINNSYDGTAITR